MRRWVVAVGLFVLTTNAATAQIANEKLEKYARTGPPPPAPQQYGLEVSGGYTVPQGKIFYQITAELQRKNQFGNWEILVNPQPAVLNTTAKTFVYNFPGIQPAGDYRCHIRMYEYVQKMDGTWTTQILDQKFPTQTIP